MENTKFKELPPWSEMPEWAMFRAVDSDGVLFAYIQQPQKGTHVFIAAVKMQGYLMIGDGYDPTNWQDSLEARPETQDAPELVPEVYRIKGTSTTIVELRESEWALTEDGLPFSPFQKRFTTPQAAAEYWQEAQNGNK